MVMRRVRKIVRQKVDAAPTGRNFEIVGAAGIAGLHEI